jgi:hypothetical protein
MWLPLMGESLSQAIDLFIQLYKKMFEMFNSYLDPVNFALINLK